MFYDVPSAPVDVTIDKETHKLYPKKFKSGSVGWYLGGKVIINGIRCQLSLSAVIIGSKPPAELIDDLDGEQLTIDDLPGLNGPLPAPKGKRPSKSPKGKKPS